MAEQRLFGMDKETNCDIMFLVLYENKLRLVSLKTNPWLKFDDDRRRERGSDIYKHDLFMFTGSLYAVPDEEKSSYSAKAIAANREKYGTRFSSDKI